MPPPPATSWAPWARMQAYSSGFFVLTAGGIGFYYPNLYLAIANVVIGLFIMGLEAPLAPFTMLGPISTSYYIRSLMYFAFLGAMVWEAPMQTAGMCLFCAAVTYLRAAINGETWSDPKNAKRGGGGGGGGGKGGGGDKKDDSKAPSR